MIVGAAVCPGAPLLVPGVAPALAAATPRLLESCRLAVATLAGADRILLLTSGPRMRDLGVRANRPTIVHRPGAAVNGAALTGSGWPARHDDLLLAGSTGPGSPAAHQSTPDAGVGVIVGAALLAGGGIDLPITAVELSDSDLTAAELNAAVGSSTDRLGVLVIGEGSAARGDESPAGGYEGAVALDQRLARALSAGEPHALSAAVDAFRQTTHAANRHPAGESESGAPATIAGQVLFTAGPAFAALAALCADRRPEVADLLFDDAPFGVGYLVATWSFADARSCSPDATAPGAAE